MEPLSTWSVPPKVVCSPIRWTSRESWFTSCCMASRSESALVPFALWSARVLMRWSMLVISSVAPSATWHIEIPSFALRLPWVRPLIWEVMRDAI